MEGALIYIFSDMTIAVHLRALHTQQYHPRGFVDQGSTLQCQLPVGSGDVRFTYPRIVEVLAKHMEHQETKVEATIIAPAFGGTPQGRVAPCG